MKKTAFLLIMTALVVIAIWLTKQHLTEETPVVEKEAIQPSTPINTNITRPTNPSLKAVIAGKSEFGITGAEDIVRARSRDLPVKAVAVIFRKSPVCFLSLTSSEIKDPRDWIGKRIAISYGENAEYEFKALLKKYDIPLSEIQAERFTFTYHRLLGGKIDVAPAYAMDQYLALKREGHLLNVIFSSDHGINPYADVLFTTEEMIRKKPEVVESVVGALLDSWLYAKDHVEETASIFVNAFPDKNFNIDHIQATVRSSLSFVLDEGSRPVGIQELSRWEETVRLAHMYGDLEKKPQASDCFTNEFTERYFLKNR
jgi:ABC-type nitrate/sulfonate/bicarbonate transport system substrate-binding protein